MLRMRLLLLCLDARVLVTLTTTQEHCLHRSISLCFGLLRDSSRHSSYLPGPVHCSGIDRSIASSICMVMGVSRAWSWISSSIQDGF